MTDRGQVESSLLHYIDIEVRHFEHLPGFMCTKPMPLEHSNRAFTAFFPVDTLHLRALHLP